MASAKYPFAHKLTGNDSIDAFKNRVEKIRAYYEHRQSYDKIIANHPEQRLATDRREVATPKSAKVARSSRIEPAPIRDIPKKDEQIRMF